MNRKMKTMQMLVVLLMMALLLVACGTAVEREAVGTRSYGSQEANVEEIIHKYIGKQSRLGRCSSDWKKAREEVRDNPTMRQELITALQSSN